MDRTASKREETFCLVAISEDDYLQLPCEQRVGVQGMLGESYTKARIFARQIVRRARKTWAQGDHRRALELLDALEAFGAGNTGPHVTRYADLVGKAIVRVAGETRKELQEAGSN
ncbi:MAG: hypothetical protein D6788_10705 [Planctomycetota bacterium]|nr:MAG: hypothetical protein D6788_10705 [Planctomycetota bacterium]